MTVLKILSGTHVGAEAELFEGTCLLGRSPDCDIALSDQMLAERHLQFHVSAKKVEVENLQPESTLAVNGKAVAEKRFELAPFAPVGIGALFFAIGPGDEQWPQIDLPILSVAKEEPEDGDESVAEKAEEGHSGAVQNKKEEKPQLSPKPASKMKKAVSALFSGKVVALAFIVAVLVTFYVQLEPHFKDSGKNKQAQVVSVEQEVKDLLATMHLNLQVSKNVAGRVLISGLIKTEKDKAGLRSALSAKKLQAGVEGVITGEYIAKSSATVLKGVMGGNVPVTVSQGEKLGTIVVKGYVETRDRLDVALRRLKEDIPSLVNIEEQIETLEDRVQGLIKILRKNKLEEALTISYENGELLLRGNLPTTRSQEWKKIEREFRELYGTIPPVKYVGLVTPTESPIAVELNILGVSLGKIPFVILSDGERYPEGSRLESGYIIEEITGEFIRLRAGEERHVFYLEEALNER